MNLKFQDGLLFTSNNFFTKNVVKVKLCEVSLEEVEMDFGVIDPQVYINGLLGLDLLMKLGAVIDLKRLSLTLDS